MKLKVNIELYVLIAIFIIGILAEGMTPDRNYETNSNQGGKSTVQQIYSIYDSFEEMINASDAKYPNFERVSMAGTKDKPYYNGFFFYNCSLLDCSQFDPTARYLLGMRVYIEGRPVLPTDTADIGVIDLKDKNKWTEIGHTTAWNWQQGCRLQWLPGSKDEIVWNDRSQDGKNYVSRIYNTSTKQIRTLPRPVYAISPNGNTALTHDFERMKHGGTNYIGITDQYANKWAPKETGVWKMDMKTGKAKMIISLDQMAQIIYSDRIPSDTAGNCLYIFREGWNPSGKRFILFVKDQREKAITTGLSMTPEGKDVHYFYTEPSHHYWLDDETILDWGSQIPRGEDKPVQGYFIFKDDDSGKAKEMLWKTVNGSTSCDPKGDWVLTDTYLLNGYEYLYLFHLPTKKLIPLGKFKCILNGVEQKQSPGIFRVDLHPRFSPNGRLISFDSSHEGFGRQIYIMDIGYIIDNPPKK
jgi:hypothetical protein